MLPNRLNHWLVTRKAALFWSAGFAVLGLLLLVPMVLEVETSVLKVSAGPDRTRRHAVAVYLSEQAAQNGLSIKLQTNAGTEDCLNLLKSKQLDVAIVSNGVVVPDDDDVMVLGAIQLEAVHLLVRKEIAENGPLIQSIRGKKVNLGEKGSTEWLLSRDYLAFARLKLPSATDTGDIVPTEYTKAQLLDSCRAIMQAEGPRRDSLLEQLPDCLIVLASMPSPVVQQLVESADYQVLPLPATRAFLLDNMQDKSDQTTVVQREFCEPTSIPKHSYFAKQNFPNFDCETVGVRLLIVARKDLPTSIVRPLMKTMFDGEFTHRILPKSPREMATPYAIHPAALAYLDRNKPLIVNEVLERVNKGMSMFGAFVAGALSLYSLLRRTKARSPSDYFAEIRKVEQLARTQSQAPTSLIQHNELLKHLEQRLLKLRHDLLEDICENRIKGDQSIANILMLINDARGNLAIADRENADEGDRSRNIYNVAKEAA